MNVSTLCPAQLNQRQWLLSVFQILLFVWMFIWSCRRPPPAPSDGQCVLVGDLTSHEKRGIPASIHSDKLTSDADTVVVGMKRELSNSQTSLGKHYKIHSQTSLTLSQS